MLVWIDIVGREMQRTGFLVNHSAAHRDRVLQDFMGKPDLFERMNPAGRESEIDRTPADHVAFTRIATAFVKINLVAAPPEIGGEQSARESTADQNKFRHSS